MHASEYGKLHDIANETASIKQIIDDNVKLLGILIVGGICITIILGAAILWNQRRIKKMLRQMQEQNAAASKNEAQEE